MIEYALEKANEKLFEELKPLIKAHDEEVPSKMGIPLEPDWEWFMSMEMAWLLNVFTARKNGKLIGYVVATKARDPLHRGLTVAAINAVYITPKERGFGADFLKRVEGLLAADGVKGIFWSIGEGSRLGVLLDRMGYVKSDAVYWGRIN